MECDGIEGTIERQQGKKNCRNLRKRMECDGMDDNKHKMVEWSNLPKELWLVISKNLNTSLDLIRFRSISTLCRSILPFPNSPSSHTLSIPHHRYFLLQTQIYCIQPSTIHHPSKGWIIKLFQDLNSSKLYLFNLFTNNRLSSDNQVLNLMNFRVVELFQLYTLTHNNNFQYYPVSDVCKVILFPVEGYHKVFSLHSDKKLHVSNIGDKETTILINVDHDGGENMCYDDIMLYMGQLYVVDENGTIFWINSLSLKLVQFSPNLYCFDKKKYTLVNSDEEEEEVYLTVSSDKKKKQLVEYDGSFYVVDLYIDCERYTRQDYFKVVYAKVYKLDQEWGKWLDVKDLGDVLFVLGKDSNFSLLAKDYHGCEGNCIYLYSKGRAYCFRLENSKCKRVNNIFWPCPTLFHPVTS